MAGPTRWATVLNQSFPIDDITLLNIIPSRPEKNRSQYFELEVTTRGGVTKRSFIFHGENAMAEVVKARDTLITNMSAWEEHVAPRHQPLTHSCYNPTIIYANAAGNKRRRGSL